MPEPSGAQHAWVQRVLGITAVPDEAARAPAPGEEGAAVRLAKSMLLWNTTRSNVARQVAMLKDTILAVTSGEQNFNEIKANIDNLDELLEVLDDSLTDKLNQMRGTTDPDLKRTLTQDARRIVAGYQEFVATDPLMNDIDANGFVPLNIKATVTASLKAVLTTI